MLKNLSNHCVASKSSHRLQSFFFATNDGRIRGAFDAVTFFLSFFSNGDIVALSPCIREMLEVTESYGGKQSEETGSDRAHVKTHRQTNDPPEELGRIESSKQKSAGFTKKAAFVAFGGV